MRSPQAGLVAATVVLVGAATGAVVLARHDQPPPALQHGVAEGPTLPPVVAGTTVHLDQVDHTVTFLPLGTRPRRGSPVSMQHAWNALVQDPSKLNPIPATVHPYYGLLTDASASRVPDLPVWGFAVEAGCVRTGRRPLPSGAATSVRPTHCRAWEFVDARTGHDLGVVEQEVLPD